jgi:hypothetical protein
MPPRGENVEGCFIVRLARQISEVGEDPGD